MTQVEVMAFLQERANPNTVRIYRRHGVMGACFGIKYSDLESLTKKLKMNHTLACGLWSTGIHDPRVLATKIANPDEATAEELQTWIEGCDNYVLTDAVAVFAARSPYAMALARRWSQDKREWIGSAGWLVFSALIQSGKVDAELAVQLLAEIETRIHGAANRMRHSMNSTLISVGGHIESLREEAIAAAKRIGPIDVKHGETGCKTPEAVAYIGRMAERNAARAQAAGGRTKARAAAGAARAAKTAH